MEMSCAHCIASFVGDGSELNPAVTQFRGTPLCVAHARIIIQMFDDTYYGPKMTTQERVVTGGINPARGRLDMLRATPGVVVTERGRS